MKVVLLKDVQGVGRRGENKEVSEGYWRNFLQPKQVAALENDPRAKQVLAELAGKKTAQAAEIEKIKELAKSFEGRCITIIAKAQGNKLFGAIHETEIAQALQIDKKQIKMQPIKSLGEHNVVLDFGHGIQATVQVQIKTQS